MDGDFINRRDPTVNVGLTKTEVEERGQAGLVNKVIPIKNRRLVHTLLGDFLSVHIVLTLLLTALVISSSNWLGLIFLSALLIEIIFKTLILVLSFKKTKKEEIQKYIAIRDGAETTLDASSIVLDDILSVKEKDLIPVDGSLKEGHIIVDESSLFGTVNPVTKNPGDKVYFGTVVLSGNAYIKCEQMDNSTYRMQKVLIKKRKRISALNKLMLILSCVAAGCLLIVLVAYGIRFGMNGGFSSSDSYKETAIKLFEFVLLVLPFEMFAFAAIALFVSLVRTKKMNARVNNLASLATLQKVDIICFDKTGVLTSNEFEVKKTLLYGNGFTYDDIDQIISNVLEATKEKSPIGKTLHGSFNYSLTKGVVSSLPYNDANKYFGATFKGGDTFAIGYSVFLNIKNRIALNHRTEEYTKQGCDVLVLAKCSSPIKDGTIDGEMTPIALIILQKQVRKNIEKLIAQLKSENLNIKIISGDDPQNAIQTATDCGIEENHHFISLKDMRKEEVEKVALEYNVFGFASAEQKAIIIETLRKQKNVVLMVGDGDNDVLALKEADVSMCVEDGTISAHACADIVALDGDLECLPKLMKEGKKISYNIQRILSLSLTKGLFGFVLLMSLFITSLTIGWSYTFKLPHFLLLEIVVCLGSLLLCFDNPKKPLSKSLVGGVLRKTIPASLVLVASVFVYFLLLLIQQKLIFYTGIYSSDTVITLSVITFSLISIAVLFKCFVRFELYSLLSFIGITLVFAGLSTAGVLIAYKNSVMNSILLIDFPSLTIVNYFVLGIVIIIVASFYLLVSYIVEIIKGEHLHAKSKS